MFFVAATYGASTPATAAVLVAAEAVGAAATPIVALPISAMPVAQTVIAWRISLDTGTISLADRMACRTHWNRGGTTTTS
ncbi:hypothetical protein [Streptosporangium carneum]|uniref:hypothetical protein n=1 Tax=Streptosporangium carneum TaxID=47481 RepID=UPI0022F31EF5|nr:hypothetical protein [Streptosporangium carneum]